MSHRIGIYFWACENFSISYFPNIRTIHFIGSPYSLNSRIYCWEMLHVLTDHVMPNRLLHLISNLNNAPLHYRVRSLCHNIFAITQQYYITLTQKSLTLSTLADAVISLSHLSLWYTHGMLQPCFRQVISLSHLSLWYTSDILHHVTKTVISLSHLSLWYTITTLTA